MRASPRRRVRWRAPAELLVVDLIAEENPKPNAKLPRHGDAGFPESFLLEFASIEAAQAGIAPQGEP